MINPRIHPGAYVNPDIFFSVFWGFFLSFFNQRIIRFWTERYHNAIFIFNLQLIQKSYIHNKINQVKLRSSFSIISKRKDYVESPALLYTQTYRITISKKWTHKQHFNVSGWHVCAKKESISNSVWSACKNVNDWRGWQRWTDCKRLRWTVLLQAIKNLCKCCNGGK